jgi:hypothetical protein
MACSFNARSRSPPWTEIVELAAGTSSRIEVVLLLPRVPLGVSVDLGVRCRDRVDACHIAEAGKVDENVANLFF